MMSSICPRWSTEVAFEISNSLVKDAEASFSIEEASEASHSNAEDPGSTFVKASVAYIVVIFEVGFCIVEVSYARAVSSDATHPTEQPFDNSCFTLEVSKTS